MNLNFNFFRKLTDYGTFRSQKTSSLRFKPNTTKQIRPFTTSAKRTVFALQCNFHKGKTSCKQSCDLTLTIIVQTPKSYGDIKIKFENFQLLVNKIVIKLNFHRD